MDPDEALRLWRAGDPDAQENLVEWLRRGGFEPRWDAATKKRFWASVAKAKRDRR